MIINWADGTTDTIPNNNGLVHIVKDVASLDDTVQINKTDTTNYMWYMVALSNNKEKVEWLAQNAQYAQDGVIYGPSWNVHLPLKSFANADTIDYCLTPTEVEYPFGKIRMDDQTVLNLWLHSSNGYPSYMDIDQVMDMIQQHIVLFKKQLDNGSQFQNNVLDDTRSQIDAYLKSNSMV